MSSITRVISITRQALVEFYSEVKDDRIAKQNLGNIVSTIPALFLSYKTIKEHGLAGSMRPTNSWATTRNHKVAAAIYFAGLSYALYQQGSRFYENWKREQLSLDFPKIDFGQDGDKVRIQMPWTLPQPTKNENWAAALADGDVTIFDRLIEVRETATKMLEEQGKEIDTAGVGKYFNLAIARQELEQMSPKELQSTAITLNRRILLLAGDGEAVNAEEERLHAALVITEEEIDRRLLHDDDFAEEFTTMLGEEEQALAVAANQHLLKRAGFNTGFSTVLEDLMEDSVEEPKIYAVDRLRGFLAQLRPGVELAFVQLDRYQDGRSIGCHLVAFENPGTRWDFRNITIALATQSDALAAAKDFLAKAGAEDLPIGGGFITTSDELQKFIRDQVIPLEWKSMSDEKLDDLVYVDLGRAPLVPLKGV